MLLPCKFNRSRAAVAPGGPTPADTGEVRP